MTDLDLDAIEARAHLRPARGSDVRALVAALREARAKVGLWEADFPCDEGCRDYPEETCSRHGRRPADLWDRSDQAFAERDDWRRRYEALRDGVTGLHFRDARGGCASCIDPDGFSVRWPCETAAVVARVERGES